ncbi:hypothetical protein Tco_1449259 [Tanacetum coccineum]
MKGKLERRLLSQNVPAYGEFVREKIRIQKKGFAIAALKNELRKLTGNSVNTKFAKPSILGKPVGQPLKNQSVVRQPTAFKSERPRISKPRFASQVNVNNDLSKPVTTHHLPKRRESAPAKPQRQEMSVENVASGLVPQGQKASDYDNSDPVPPRQNVVPSVEKTDSSNQGLEFLFSPLLEEYYNPTHDQAEENNNDQAPNASFQEDNLSISFLDNRHDYRWTRDHPLEQVRRNPTMPVQTRRQLTTDPEMCMFTLTVSIVEPKNIKVGQCRFCMDRSKYEVIKAKGLGRNKKEEESTEYATKHDLVLKRLSSWNRALKGLRNHFSPVARLEAEEVYVAQPDGFVDPDHPEKSNKKPTQEALYGIKQAPSACNHFQTLIMPDALILGKALLRDTFLGDKLVIWMSKKQNITAMSFTEASKSGLNCKIGAQ